MKTLLLLACLMGCADVPNFKYSVGECLTSGGDNAKIIARTATLWGGYYHLAYYVRNLHSYNVSFPRHFTKPSTERIMRPVECLK